MIMQAGLKVEAEVYWWVVMVVLHSCEDVVVA